MTLLVGSSTVFEKYAEYEEYAALHIVDFLNYQLDANKTHVR